MDIQMPVMGGLEAARRIRQWEQEQQVIAQATASAPRQRLPIIAMTAHAMDKDREQSLAAGMDAHVTKPLDPKHLLATIRKLLTPETSEAALPVSRPQSSSKSRIQHEAAAWPEQVPGLALQATLDRLGNNENLYRRMLWKFQQDFADTDRELGEAIDRKDWEQVRYMTHAIKGVAGNIGAYDVHMTAAALEASLTPGAESEPASALMRFSKALRRVLQSLQQLALQDTPPANTESGGPKSTPPVFSKEKLEALLQQLEPVIHKRQPKHCQQIMQEILRSSWPEETTQQLVALHQLLRKYKFREAQEMLHTLRTPQFLQGGDHA